MTGSSSREPTADGHSSNRCLGSTLIIVTTQLVAALTCSSAFAIAGQAESKAYPSLFLSAVTGGRDENYFPAPDRRTVASRRLQRHLHLEPQTSSVEYLTPNVEIKRLLEPVRSLLHWHRVKRVLQSSRSTKPVTKTHLIGCTFSSCDCKWYSSNIFALCGSW